MNTLSFVMEQKNYRRSLFQKPIKYNVFYYVVDGKKIDAYEPLGSVDVFYLEEDNIFEGHDGIFLNVCECGEFYCGCWQAAVFKNDKTVVWKIHEINESEIIAEYEFDLDQYEKAISELHECAKQNFNGDGIYYYNDGRTWSCPKYSEEQFIFEKKYGDKENRLLYYEDCKTRERFCYKDGKVVPYIE